MYRISEFTVVPCINVYKQKEQCKNGFSLRFGRWSFSVSIWWGICSSYNYYHIAWSHHFLFSKTLDFSLFCSNFRQTTDYQLKANRYFEDKELDYVSRFVMRLMHYIANNIFSFQKIIKHYVIDASKRFWQDECSYSRLAGLLKFGL